MGIKTIPLSRLETNLRQTLSECADTGEALVVELPDRRSLAIQPVSSAADDSLVDDLLQSNPDFQQLIQKSSASPRKPFTPRAGT